MLAIVPPSSLRAVRAVSVSSLGKLDRSNMGVFQIVGQNSDEDYSWGGSFNTSSKEKTASITVNSTYNIK